MQALIPLPSNQPGSQPVTTLLPGMICLVYPDGQVVVCPAPEANPGLPD